MSTLTRTFDGKLYICRETYSVHSEAKESAKDLRKNGKGVKIVLAKNTLLPSYELWVNQEEKGRE